MFDKILFINIINIQLKDYQGIIHISYSNVLKKCRHPLFFYSYIPIPSYDIIIIYLDL